MRDQPNFEASTRTPLLCIEIIRDDPFSDLRKRCDRYLVEGALQVWILDPDSKRAYTVTKTEGLSEFQDKVLQVTDPPLVMDLNKIFD